MQRPYLKYFRITGIILLVILVFLGIGGYIAYSKREAFLQKAILKAKITAKTKYNLNLEIGSAHFTGLSTVALDNVTLVPENRDSLLTIKQFEVSIKLLPLILGKVKLENVLLENGHLNLTDVKHIKNFDFLSSKKTDTVKRASLDIAELSNNLINQVLYKIPDNLEVSNFLVSFKSDSSNFNVLAQSVIIKNGLLTSTFNLNKGAAIWHVAGRMHPSEKDIAIKLYADGKKIELPYIENRYKLKVNFDTLFTRLSKVTHSDGETDISGSWDVNNFLIHQSALSSNDILVPSGGIDADISIGTNFIAIDSTSVIHLKEITAHPFIKYTLKPVKIYELKLNTGWLNAQGLFNSLPSGIFDSLEGIRVTGKLNYSLNIFLNTAHPDDLIFDSRMGKENFNVLGYGKTDLAKLNNTFTYIPYEKGKPMPARVIGPSNPYFTPLEEISSNLRNAVMTAEDPSFYSNNGFVEEAIRKSLATDFKDKKFKRGGSTISMQLVKNAFLSREKTLARKIEEELIVWLIVNNHIMTKNRMLEVYLNIIEWGRNVYGIGEGSRYYFGKPASELDLGESIFMASIVPHPKTGLYAFLPDGSLRPSLAYYFKLIGNLMAGKGAAERDTTGAYGLYSVRLKESLRQEIAPVNPAVADSLLKQNNDDEDAAPVIPAPEVKKPGFFQKLFGKKDTLTTKEENKLKKQEAIQESNKDRVKKEIEKLKDDEKQKEEMIDTAGKTRKQIRQEKRKMRDDEKDQEKVLKSKG